MVYQTAPFAMTLNDPNPVLKVTPFFDAGYLINGWIYGHNKNYIARQLRTQYVEGIYRPKYYTVTLKSRLGVTQRHWKQNHWIDHTRLRPTISRVIWRWILSSPWNVG